MDEPLAVILLTEFAASIGWSIVTIKDEFTMETNAVIMGTPEVVDMLTEEMYDV